MTERVVVLGAGYAGTGAVKSLQSELGPGTELVWVSKEGFHLVLHESHRVIRDPSVADRITIPVERVADAGTEFVQGEVTGGAGLSGIQTAGEVARFRDDHGAPVEVHLVEALEEIFPGHDASVQEALRERLEAAGVRIATDDPITEATDSRVHFEEADPLDYDVFIWTGGITGREAAGSLAVEKDERSNRVHAGETFRTSDDRVFAIGDSALIDQGDAPAPPTAQAAWQAAEVVGENIARAIGGKPLKSWTYEDKGTLVSVGERAIAHDVAGMPVDTFNSYPAEFLKKFVAARWIAGLTSWRYALRAWSVL